MKKGISAVTVALAAFALLLAGCGGDNSTPSASAAPSQHYTATLAALNDSGVTGTADFTLTGNQLVINVKLNGATAKQGHAQHIHGTTGKQATCPTIAAIDKTGVVSLNAGGPYYGPVALGLQPATASASGVVNFTSTMTLKADDKAKITPLNQHVYVIHGVLDKGKYDGLLPAACGAITAAK
jgi:hypothetical protein